MINALNPYTLSTQPPLLLANYFVAKTPQPIGCTCSCLHDNDRILFSPLAVRSPGAAEYGAAPQNYPIVLGRLVCVGTETSIFDCPQANNALRNCYHGGDAGAECEGTLIDPFVHANSCWSLLCIMIYNHNSACVPLQSLVLTLQVFAKLET